MGGHEQRPAGEQDPAKLAEHQPQLGPWHVVQQVERDQAGTRAAAQWQAAHVPGQQGQARVAAPGDGQHAEGGVDADDIAAPLGQITPDMRRAAPEVDHGPVPGRAPGGGVEHLTVHLDPIEVIGVGPCVVLGDRRVRPRHRPRVEAAHPPNLDPPRATGTMQFRWLRG